MTHSHDINTLVQDDASLERFAHLSKLLIKHGNDKSGNHGCYSLEDRILSGLRARKSIPEISMGSNTLDVVSNMGFPVAPELPEEPSAICHRAQRAIEHSELSRQ
jgi:hypothetical protein